MPELTRSRVEVEQMLFRFFFLMTEGDNILYRKQVVGSIHESDGQIHVAITGLTINIPLPETKPEPRIFEVVPEIG